MRGPTSLIWRGAATAAVAALVTALAGGAKGQCDSGGAGTWPEDGEHDPTVPPDFDITSIGVSLRTMVMLQWCNVVSCKRDCMPNIMHATHRLTYIIQHDRVHCMHAWCQQRFTHLVSPRITTGRSRLRLRLRLRAKSLGSRGSVKICPHSSGHPIIFQWSVDDMAMCCMVTCATCATATG